MKKLILLLIIPFAALLITSCDTGNNPITSETTRQYLCIIKSC